MKGRVNALSGRGSSFIAYLLITTDGDAQITAVNTVGDSYSGTADSTGSLTLTVYNYGVYTITVVGTGTQTTVSVAENGQYYNIAITTWDGELYDAGNEYAFKTGGWIAEQGRAYPQYTSIVPTIQKLSDRMVIRVSPNARIGAVITSDTIDITDYSTLYVTCSNDYYHPGSSFMGYIEYYLVDSQGNFSAPTGFSFDNTSTMTFNLNIANYSGDYRIGFNVRSYQDYQSSSIFEELTLFKVWLE